VNPTGLEVLSGHNLDRYTSYNVTIALAMTYLFNNGSIQTPIAMGLHITESDVPATYVPHSDFMLVTSIVLQVLLQAGRCRSARGLQ
jgi:hypothetical protein